MPEPIANYILFDVVAFFVVAVLFWRFMRFVFRQPCHTYRGLVYVVTLTFLALMSEIAGHLVGVVIYRT